MGVNGERTEHLRNLGVAAASAIPIVGGPLSVLLDKYLPSYVEERRKRLLAQLSADMEDLASRITLERLGSDEFISVFIKGFRLAMEEHLQEKRDAFRAIILNTALSAGSCFDELTLFIRLVADLTVDQMRIVRLLREDWSSELDNAGLYQAAQQLWPGIDEDYLVACVTELLRYNLVTFSDKQQRLIQEKKRQHSLTALGERFVSYVTLPAGIAETRPGGAEQH